MAESIIAEAAEAQAPDDLASYQVHAARQSAVFMRYWSIAEAMRLAGELPEWVRKANPGHGGNADYEEYRAARMLSKLSATGRPTTPRYYVSSDPHGMTVVEREGHRVAFSGPSLNVAQHVNLEEFMPSQLRSLIARVKLDIDRERTLLRIRERRISLYARRSTSLALRRIAKQGQAKR